MKLTKVVTEVLARDLLARSSDSELILQVCERLGCEFTAKQKEVFDSMPKIASIIRIRARLQAEGRFRPQDNCKSKEIRI